MLNVSGGSDTQEDLMRRTLTAIATLVIATSTVQPATALTAADNHLVQRVEQTRAAKRAADRAAIVALVDAYRRWLEHLAAIDGRWYTGPECPGRYRIPVWIVWRESRCSATARNPASSAGGYYQMLIGTFATSVRGAGLPQWAGTNAAAAPPAVQHAAARWLIDNYGLSPWAL